MDAAAGCVVSESSANAVVPFFGRPFAGPAPVGNDFDHDLPLAGAENGYLLTLCGVRDATQVDGHPGYDYRLPEGTPLLAVADGTVLFAGLEPLHPCPELGRSVQSLLVEIVHHAPNGEELVSVYGHLSRVDVATGDRVSSGTVIGLSGNTGCSGTPHLHFGVARKTGAEYRLFDPYGWHGAGADPWAVDPRGAESTWLWKDGQAPPLQ
jgi:murein DD-endopeptidase MepM/ murein hydrolase activator NlpD